MKTPTQLFRKGAITRQGAFLLMFITLVSWHAAANRVLLFYDADYVVGLGTTRYRAALENRGYPYQYFTDSSSFSQAVQAADPASDVVVVDALALFHDLSSVTAFVQAGGRALVQYWNLAGDPALATALEVFVPSALTEVTSPHDWGGSELFTGISTPLVLTHFTAESITHGQRFQPIGGGQAVAGFFSFATVNEAALVIGNSGRTIAQGFFTKEIELVHEAEQFAQNELDFLFGPIAPDTGPSIITDPKARTVLVGSSTTLRVHAGGSLPLSYQWQKEGTDIPGATDAFFSIVNAQLDQTGSYVVVVSNSHYAVSSAAALLTVTDPGPTTNILLMDDDNVFPSPYEEALAMLGLNYERFSDPNVFSSEVGLANPAHTLVILDAYGSPWRYSELVDFVEAGGRALMQNWDLTTGTHLADAFDVSVLQRNDSVLSVYDWSGSPFFDGVTTPIVSTPLPPPYTPFVHGQKLQPLDGGTAVAGFVSGPADGEAAIVVGKAGRTIANGFMLEEITPGSEAIILARNQILHFYPTPPPAPVAMFSDDFEAGLSNWAATSGATILDWSFNQNQVPGGAGHSAMLNHSLDKMFHNLGAELSGWSKATFYIYDDTATRAYGEVRSYVEEGYSPAATLQNVYAIGKYNAVTMPGEIFDGTKYQGRIAIGPGPNGWFNLNAPGAPNRSPGWHRFQILRLADGVTYRFYVDGVLGRSFTAVSDFPWDTVTIGSVAAGTSLGDAYFDGVEISSLSETVFPVVPLNIHLINNAVVLSWTNVSFTLQSAPTVNGMYTNVPGAISPYTNTLAGSQSFFRLIEN